MCTRDSPALRWHLSQPLLWCGVWFPGHWYLRTVLCTTVFFFLLLFHQSQCVYFIGCSSFSPVIVGLVLDHRGKIWTFPQFNKYRYSRYAVLLQCIFILYCSKQQPITFMLSYAIMFHGAWRHSHLLLRSAALLCKNTLYCNKLQPLITVLGCAVMREHSVPQQATASYSCPLYTHILNRIQTTTTYLCPHLYCHALICHAAANHNSLFTFPPSILQRATTTNLCPQFC